MRNPQVRVFTGEGETASLAADEAEQACNLWFEEDRFLPGSVSLHTAATVSVIVLPEGITETYTHAITVLFDAAPWKQKE